MDPQTIADGISQPGEYEKGTRPLRYPLDATAQGTDVEFIKARADIKAKWVAAYAVSKELGGYRKPIASFYFSYSGISTPPPAPAVHAPALSFHRAPAH